MLIFKYHLFIFQRGGSELFLEFGDEARAVGEARQKAGIGYREVGAEKTLGEGETARFNIFIERDFKLWTVLWNYSNHFMNFDGRVCLDASARFGVLALGLGASVAPVQSYPKRSLKCFKKKLIFYLITPVCVKDV